MRADQQRAPTQAGQPTIRVRVATVESLLNAADWTVAELSRRARMDHSAVARLLRGDLSPGGRSIAGFLHAFGQQFPRVGFYDVFEVVVDDAAVAPPALSVYDDEEPRAATA